MHDGKPPKPLKKVLTRASKTLSSDDDDYGDDISDDADADGNNDNGDGDSGGSDCDDVDNSYACCRAATCKRSHPQGPTFVKR